MPSVNNIKVTIGGAETTAGTAVEREYVLPIRGMPDIDRSVEREPDPAIVGRNMSAGDYAVAENVAGTIPLSIRACGGIGQVFNSLLGTETLQSVSACIRVRYSGTNASTKVVVTDNLISVLTGTKGSESLDTDFETDGHLSLLNASYDIMSEMATAIEAFTNYEGETVWGDGNTLSSTLNAVTSRQAEGMWAYLFGTGTSSTAYRHTFTPDIGDDERPVYTVQFDGRQYNHIYDGVVVDSMSLSAALKGMVEGEISILGMAETSTGTASTLTLEDIEPLIFWNGGLSIGNTDYTYLRNVNLTVSNNHNSEGYGQGSKERLYQQKGEFVVTGSVQVRLDSNSITERAKVVSGALAGISLYFKGNDTIASSKPYAMIVEIPYASITDFDFPENAGVLDANINFKATYPKGSPYNDPFTVHLITDDSGAY